MRFRLSSSREVVGELADKSRIGENVSLKARFALTERVNSPIRWRAESQPT
jgi:hypothetical protein